MEILEVNMTQTLLISVRWDTHTNLREDNISDMGSLQCDDYNLITITLHVCVLRKEIHLMKHILY